MILLCNRVHELYIIKISVESRALPSCYDLEGTEIKEKRKNKKEIKRDHIDLMESNDFTYKEYDE